MLLPCPACSVPSIPTKQDPHPCFSESYPLPLRFTENLNNLPPVDCRPHLPPLLCFHPVTITLDPKISLPPAWDLILATLKTICQYLGRGVFLQCSCCLGPGLRLLSGGHRVASSCFYSQEWPSSLNYFSGMDSRVELLGKL